MNAKSLPLIVFAVVAVLSLAAHAAPARGPQAGYSSNSRSMAMPQVFQPTARSLMHPGQDLHELHGAAGRNAVLPYRHGDRVYQVNGVNYVRYQPVRNVVRAWYWKGPFPVLRAFVRRLRCRCWFC